MNETKYTKWYLELIETRKQNNVVGYTENHHIIPKSLGGSNHVDNLIRLTAREHYVAHLLLQKCYNDSTAKQKMTAAFMYLAKARNSNTKKRYNSRLYEYHKMIRIKMLKETMTGSGNHNFGKKHSTETRKKISAARKGVNTNTPESNAKKRKRFQENNPNYNPELKKKIIAGKAKYNTKYIIEAPSGEIIKGSNLAKFCREQKIQQGNLLTYGHTKGWKLLTKETHK